MASPNCWRDSPDWQIKLAKLLKTLAKVHYLVKGLLAYSSNIKEGNLG
jgi:hypothetical protein